MFFHTDLKKKNTNKNVTKVITFILFKFHSIVLVFNSKIKAKCAVPSNSIYA